MGIERAYIRKTLLQCTEAGTEISDEESCFNPETMLVQIKDSSQVEGILTKKPNAPYKRLIHFLFAHKEKLKKVPVVGSYLIAKKNQMLEAALSEKQRPVIDLSDCIGWYWNDFLVICYQRLLNRQPDPEGINTYGAMAAEGADNRVIAYAVASSPEFAQRDVLLHQMEYQKVYRKFVRKRKWKNIPMIGRIVRLFALPGQIGLLRSRVERSEAALIHCVQMQQQENAALIQQLIGRFEQGKIDLAGDLRAYQQERAELAECVRGLEKGQAELAECVRGLEKGQAELAECVRGLEKGQAEFAECIHVQQERAHMDSCPQMLTMLSQKMDTQAVISTSVSEKLDALPMTVRNEEILSHTAVSGFSGGVIGVTVDQFVFGVPSEEWGLAMFLSRTGHFEPGSERLFESLLTPEMTVLDLGANLGIYTLRALRIGCSVFSYEPTPETFHLLQQNVKANGFAETGRSHLVQAAVSDACGTMTFYQNANMCGHNSFYKIPSSVQTSVDTVTLDSQKEAFGSVDFIKLDVEGAEYSALCGMRKLLEENPKVQIIMEFAPGNIRRAGQEPVVLLALLRRDLGFQIYRIDENTGMTAQVTDQELLDTFSVNLYLKKEEQA